MDPISNMLSIIKNGYLARKPFVTIPCSKLTYTLADKLTKLNYLKSIAVLKESNTLKIELLYTNYKPAVTEIKRLSKPSLRVYRSSSDIPRILSGRGEVLITTSKGIMSGSEAKKQNLGGELILKIW